MSKWYCAGENGPSQSAGDSQHHLIAFEPNALGGGVGRFLLIGTAQWWF